MGKRRSRGAPAAAPEGPEAAAAVGTGSTVLHAEDRIEHWRPVVKNVTLILSLLLVTFTLNQLFSEYPQLVSYFIDEAQPTWRKWLGTGAFALFAGAGGFLVSQVMQFLVWLGLSLAVTVRRRRRLAREEDARRKKKRQEQRQEQLQEKRRSEGKVQGKEQ